MPFFAHNFISNLFELFFPPKNILYLPLRIDSDSMPVSLHIIPCQVQWWLLINVNANTYANLSGALVI